MPHEALAHPGLQRYAAASASVDRLDGFRGGRRLVVASAVRLDELDDRGGGVVGPCEQWSIRGLGRATLMRHVLWCLRAALAPAPRALRMGQAAAVRALVAASSLAGRRLTRQSPAGSSAVAVAAIAAATQHHLLATARAQE
ncbi:hypothetical protein D8B31_20700 [Verminephrobacter eiseniae]|nr:hypothetical protein [Verminephrobacter eiseniae]MCW8186958.1 hypothetical protein [Verminephrobacter eiseniae]MCW8225344.1 hypothetical protein [Verminephrobacter eiseniae]